MKNIKNVYVGLSADILHEGHINILKTASQYGNVIVGLLTDEAIASYKNIPYLDFKKRKVVVENIKYGKRAKNPVNCVNTKEGVCQDYSELFKALCDIAQIECYIVIGNGKTNSTDIGFYDSNHAWNIIKINGKPCMYYPCKASKAVKQINDFFVSSDDTKILRFGKKYGFETIKRPKNRCSSCR